MGYNLREGVNFKQARGIQKGPHLQPARACSNPKLLRKTLVKGFKYGGLLLKTERIFPLAQLFPRCTLLLGHPVPPICYHDVLYYQFQLAKTCHNLLGSVPSYTSQLVPVPKGSSQAAGITAVETGS